MQAPIQTAAHALVADSAMETETKAETQEQIHTEASFTDLLARTPSPTASLIHGVVVADLLNLLPDGSVCISVPAFNLQELIARPICALNTLQAGQQVAVMFEQGDISRALVLGPMAHAVPQAVREMTVNQQRVIIEAEDELELRCGEACIILTADGRIVSRANYISSHASATQRLQGGAVQIN